MSNYKIIDGHCDTLTLMADNIVDLSNTYNHISIEKLKKGNVSIQFFAVWLDPKDRFNSCFENGLRIIDCYYKMLDRYDNIFSPIFTFKDVLTSLKNEKIGCILAIEGGDILDGNLENLNKLYELGVRVMTLTWNYANEISSGILDTSSKDNGLTTFGKKVIQNMNDLGMIIDVSHISYKGFWDVCEFSNKPIIASHSNARTICNNIRNLDDKQLKSIAEKEGIVGINFYPPFLSDSENAHITDIVRHIEYIAALIGIDYIGFGSDFDGVDRLPNGVYGSESFLQIIEELLKLNYKEEYISKICNGNMLRIFKSIL